MFGIVPAGLPLIIQPASTPSHTSYLYTLPTTKPFSHLVVFLLPNVTLPSDTAAAIYIATAQEVTAAAQSNSSPNFKFLGGIGPGKESAMFKVGSLGNSSISGTDSGSCRNQNELIIGISIEPAHNVSQRMQDMVASKPTADVSSSQLSTIVLAQRIIQNAFNFLASFSGNAGTAGIEVVPLRAFENWWRKFESRVRSDPSFLEKQSD